jgi:hypothetical protein
MISKLHGLVSAWIRWSLSAARNEFDRSAVRGRKSVSHVARTRPEGTVIEAKAGSWIAAYSSILTT